MNLALLRPGQKAVVKQILLKGILRRRVMDMGIIVGALVEVNEIAPLGDPIKLTVMDYQLSLRKSEAEGIVVEVK